MATIRCKYKGSLDGSAPVYRPFPVGDNQTIYAGDVVILSSAKAVISTDAAGAGTVIGVSNTDIITTTATATDTIMVDINPMSIYEVPYTGTASSLAIGAKYDMGAAAYQIDIADTTGGYFQLLPQADDGAAYNAEKLTVDVILCNRVYGQA